MRKLTTLLTVAAVAATMLLGAPAPAGAQQRANWDFESGDLSGWTATGDAFANQPTVEDNAAARNPQDPSHLEGDWWIGTYEDRPTPGGPAGGFQGDKPTGELRSDPFDVDACELNFLVGGGGDAERTYVGLEVDGSVVARWPGSDQEGMKRRSFDLRPYRGATARIVIVDDATADWGHINADDFHLDDSSCPGDEEDGEDPGDGQDEETDDGPDQSPVDDSGDGQPGGSGGGDGSGAGNEGGEQPDTLDGGSGSGSGDQVGPSTDPAVTELADLLESPKRTTFERMQGWTRDTAATLDKNRFAFGGAMRMVQSWLGFGQASEDRGPNVSDSDGDSTTAEVATSGDDVYVVWSDNTDGDYDVYLTISHDRGARFGQPVNLSNSAGQSISPHVAAEGRNVSVVWEDNTPGNLDVFHRRSIDGGANWGTGENLSRNAGASVQPHVAVTGGNAYVAWGDTTGGGMAALVTRVGSGVVARPSEDLTIRRPRLAATDGRFVFVVWQADTNGDEDVFIARSEDSAATFRVLGQRNAGGALVSTRSDYGDQRNPVVAADGERVVFAYETNESLHPAVVVFSYDHDHGSGMFAGGGERITQYDGPQSFDDASRPEFLAASEPDVALRGSRTLVAYRFHRLLGGGGSTSELTAHLTGSPRTVVGEGTLARVVLTGDGTGIVTDNAGRLTLTVTGGGRSNAVTLTTTADDPSQVRIAASGDRAVAVWVQHDGDQREVFIRSVGPT